MKVPKNWQDYELLDAGEGEKLERWGLYILRRPDPQAVWDKNPALKLEWDTASAIYNRSETGGGSWSIDKPLPTSWNIEYKNLKFVIKPTGFKHTGLFPEQAYNWDFLMNVIEENVPLFNRAIRVLNLFAYTGGVTVACLAAGAEVTHVDSSKQILSLARENINASNLQNRFVRFIAEDALSFVKKEIRRGNQYDIIIMDPPTFGRGDKGQVWKIERDLNNLVKSCVQLLSKDALAFLINTYVSGISGQSLANMLQRDIMIERGGKIEFDEIGLPLTDYDLENAEIILPAGVFARWSKS